MLTLEKTKREEAILLSLKKLDFLSRSQLQRIHKLGGTRNANRILKDMEPYLQSHRGQENIYYLSKLGREQVDCKKVRRINTKLTHYLMRNELYIHLGLPHTWQNEIKIKYKDMAVITDAIYQRQDVWHFVEVDHEQSMGVNKQKVELYKKLKEVQEFKLVWLTCTELRRRKLKQLCDGLRFEIHTMSDIK